MIRTERDKVREARKIKILEQFAGKRIPLTVNEVARKVDIVWPVAFKLLTQLVEEGRLYGDKLNGYTLYPPEIKKQPSLAQKVRQFLHVQFNA